MAVVGDKREIMRIYEFMSALRSNGKQTDFNQQKRGEMTHYTLKISFCIPTIERFEKIIQVR